MKRPKKYRPFKKRVSPKVLWTIVVLIILWGMFNQAMCQNLWIANDALDEMKLHFNSYQDSMKVEVAMCFYGHVSGDTTYIMDVETPPQLHSKYQTIARFQYCKGNMVAWGHSHPKGWGKLSELDINLAVKMGIDTILIYRHNGDFVLHWYSPKDIAALWLERNAKH